MTCAEPTLFLGTSAVAATAVPPSATASAMHAMMPAGVGFTLFIAALPSVWCRKHR
jgi:hypothetical protein